MTLFLAIYQGVFVAFVQAGLPAALAGLRFGDQILQINGQTVAGWDNDKVHKFLKKADAQRIEMAVRDRWVDVWLFIMHLCNVMYENIQYATFWWNE